MIDTIIHGLTTEYHHPASPWANACLDEMFTSRIAHNAHVRIN
jgi:hypothetical protein